MKKDDVPETKLLNLAICIALLEKVSKAAAFEAVELIRDGYRNVLTLCFALNSVAQVSQWS